MLNQSFAILWVWITYNFAVPHHAISARVRGQITRGICRYQGMPSQDSLLNVRRISRINPIAKAVAMNRRRAAVIPNKKKYARKRDKKDVEKKGIDNHYESEYK